MRILYHQLEKKDKERSMRQVAKEYLLAWETLRDRLTGKVVSREKYAHVRQRLSPAEERVLEEDCLQLEKWGCPACVCQLKFMANKLFSAKEDTTPVRKNWPSAFLQRHSNLKSVFTTPKDRNRQLSKDWDIINHWFELYKETRDTHKVRPKDTYNIDEKGCALGQGMKARSIVSKSNTQPHTSHDGNREWATLFKAISLTGKVLSPWVIFKGKMNQPAWQRKLKALREEEGEEFIGHICVSPNGWTDTELSLEWLEQCFEPETSKGQKGKYRLLLWDGHSSHISPAAIRFCVDHKIIALCLPPHTTHLLQPCDVGLFGPLAILYKNEIMRRARPGAIRDVNKEMFLEVYCQVRSKALNLHNIQSA
jgi:hypothetical protein